MRRSRYHKLSCITRLRTALFVCGLFLLFMPQRRSVAEEEKDVRLHVFMNGKELGVVESREEMYAAYRDARREIALSREGMSLIPLPDMVTLPDDSLDNEELTTAADMSVQMKDMLADQVTADYAKAYSVKVGETMVNVSSADEVREIFQETIAAYDPEGDFEVVLANDLSRELNVLVPRVSRKEQKKEEELLLNMGGAALITDDTRDWDLESSDVGFDSFDYGIEEMSFSDRIEIVEAILPKNALVPYEEAKSKLTDLQELQQIYKVEAGDTLSGISLKVGLPLDQIISLNSDALENENSVIRIDQELIITVPEPALSVIWTETTRTAEVYDLPTEYILNDEWYTSKSETLQQPSAGYHETVSLITRRNTEVEEKEVLYEEVGVQAVAKVVEKGTKVPPTYIKPLAGGRISSGFGRRSSPGGIGSTNHQGLDIATPIGTSIWASSGGTVSYAGWAAGYGYLVTIKHPDGWETRYAHLSRVVVSVGQYVEQGQLVAYSGNTGNSTGPHLHFEIRIGGVAQDPRGYVTF
ncbi:MAG: M23 family metallopeptidase [Lachnospiraceae bacterium]|nr:M23 family metallopeptidase [Lachnospiraceae bacterium]